MSKLQSFKSWSLQAKVNGAIGAALCVTLIACVLQERLSVQLPGPSKPVSSIPTLPSVTAGLYDTAPINPRTEIIPVSVAADKTTGVCVHHDGLPNPELCSEYCSDDDRKWVRKFNEESLKKYWKRGWWADPTEPGVYWHSKADCEEFHNHPVPLYGISASGPTAKQDDHWGECPAGSHWHDYWSNVPDWQRKDFAESIRRWPLLPGDTLESIFDGTCHEDSFDKPVVARPKLPKPQYMPNKKAIWV